MATNSSDAPKVNANQPAEAASAEREALDKVFEQNPGLKGYLLDDQDCLRRHVAISVDNVMIKDRIGLGDALGPNSEIYVLQSLTGG